MSLSHSPKIVTNGLVLCLDAANQKSYPGSGSSWFDISGQNQNFTLYNSPTFSTNKGGELLFSNSNDYARIRNSSSIKSLASNGTVSVWFRTISSTLGLSSYARLVSFSDEAGTGSDTTSAQGLNRDYSDYMCLVKNNAESLGVWYKNNPTAFGPSTLVNTNVYFNAVISWATNSTQMTFNFYLNGSNTNTTTITQSAYISSTASTITIGQNCYGALTNPMENSTCAFSAIKMYSRALSATEIKQNFNALRGRFGL